jgi:tetratricopeptide (TPR) repeat protein
MQLTLMIAIPAAVLAYLVFRVMTGHGVLGRALRTARTVNQVMTEFMQGNYEAALQKSGLLKDGDRLTAEYCFMSGSILHQLGRLTEAESRLRQGLPLEEDPRQKALVYNTIADVLTGQERYPEAIAFFENAGHTWPDRGANHRGIAEVWLRQGREFAEALEHARQAVQIDKIATGLKKQALDSRLGEDLAVLAWAIAENGGSRSEVDKEVAESLRLCDKGTKSALAEVHFHAGKAYAALKCPDESQKHLRQSSEIDPNGSWGRMARAAAGL